MQILCAYFSTLQFWTYDLFMFHSAYIFTVLHRVLWSALWRSMETSVETFVLISMDISVETYAKTSSMFSHTSLNKCHHRSLYLEDLCGDL